MTNYLTNTIGVTIVIVLLAAFSCCAQKETAKTPSATKSREKKMIDWAKNAVIYEVNIRQHTKEGTFNALTKDLPRLKALGVDILWLMPIHPIGVKNRKGGVGSHYSVQDYQAVNPDYGTMDDFKALVKAAHKEGLYIIIDWVANHTAWDHVWVEAHPDWYTRNDKGEMEVPRGDDGNLTDWLDVADLNFNNAEMRKAMVAAMQFWLKEANIDGYRCDVAGFVPYDFWDALRPQLEAVKPVFMLAEWEDPKHHEKCFDMSYAWEFHHLTKEIVKGNKTAADLDLYLKKDKERFPKNSVRMLFITNHDENSWNGTVQESYGAAADAFAVLCWTFDTGMPLMYTGQEADLDRKLAFFEKDAVDWKGYPKSPFYKTLNNLRHNNKALWADDFSREATRFTSPAASVYAFGRTDAKGKNKVVVILNLSGDAVKTTLDMADWAGDYQDHFTKKFLTVRETQSLELGPWGYQVLVAH